MLLQNDPAKSKPIYLVWQGSKHNPGAGPVAARAGHVGGDLIHWHDPCD
jgi:hypothetical protein